MFFKIQIPSSTKQTFFALLIGALPGISMGMVLGYSAVMLPRLGDKYSSEQQSWIASITALLPILGCLILGVLSQKIGRKLSLIIGISTLFIGWIIMPFAKHSLPLILVGRTFQGFGVVVSLLQLYLVEISDLSNRDLNCSFPSVSINIGITFIYVLDLILDDWALVAYFGAGFSALTVFLIIIFNVPESPYWLIQSQKFEEARKSLIRLKGEDQVQEDIEKIKETIQNNGSLSCSLQDQMKELKSLEVLKPLGILLLIGTLSQATGQYTFAFYAVGIFTEFLPDLREEAYYSAIGVGVVRILASIAGIFFVRRFKRRKLLIINSLLMGLCLFIVAGIIGIKPYIIPEIVEAYEWIFQILPIILLGGYIIFFGIGVNLIPYLLFGELCPSKIKNLTTSLSIGFMSISIFTFVKIFPTLMDNLGGSATYSFYGSFCVGLALFTYTTIPETSNKSIQELQSIYRKEKSPDSSTP